VRRLANDYTVSDVSLVKIMNEARANQYPDFPEHDPGVGYGGSSKIEDGRDREYGAKCAQSPSGLATKTDIPDGRQH